MTPETIFQLSNLLAIIAWLILIFIPVELNADRVLINIVILLLCGVYVWLASGSFDIDDIQKFSSIEGIATLFQNKYILTAGWIHYLAFDLLAGIFIRRNALQHGINYWLVLVCLLLTFLMGPLGLGIYLVLRWIRSKQFFAANFPG